MKYLVPRVVRTLAKLAAVLGVAGGSAIGATACGEDEAPAAPPATNACESKAYCYEREGGLDASEKSACEQVGSTIAAACDPKKAVRKCSEAKTPPGGGKDIVYVYFYREGDTTGCAGVEEKL